VAGASWKWRPHVADDRASTMHHGAGMIELAESAGDRNFDEIRVAARDPSSIAGASKRNSFSRLFNAL
jgi:hypothetical protein